MAGTYDLNQFAYVEQKGSLKNPDKGIRMDCKVYDSEAGTLVPGTCVKLVDVTGDVITVQAIAADTDTVFGTVAYDAAKKNTYVAGEMVTIARDYSLLKMEASAAIAAGAAVMPVVTGAKVATATAGKTVIGTALTKASTTGDLILVELSPYKPSVALGTVTALSGAGAIPITHQVVKVTTTGANALTLADGADGQRLSIVMVTDGGDGTITPANFGNGSTITINDAGDSVSLVFTNSKWYITSNSGCTVA